MKKLKEIINDVNIIKTVGDINITVEGITDNSKLVKNNYLFFAIKGLSLDGHRYINNAIKKGCKVVICSYLPIKINSAVCYICLLYTSPSPRDQRGSRMPSSA